jgi:hypothetical protein
MTLRIKKRYTDFIKDIFIGQRAFFIELDEHGFEEDILKLSESISMYNYVYIYGDEFISQDEDITNLIKNIKKNNPNVKIIINVNGIKKPTSVAGLNIVTFFVKIKSKYSGLGYNERINEKVLKWYSKAGAYFIYDVFDEEDFEEINSLIIENEIKKYQVFINLNNLLDKKMVMSIMKYGYNIYIKVDGDWFDK